MGVWGDAVEFACFDQGRPARPGVAARVARCVREVARDAGGLAGEGDGADGVFGGIGVPLDPAIGQEDLQPIPVTVDPVTVDPVTVDMAEVLAKAGFGGDAAALLGQPLAEVSGLPPTRRGSARAYRL